jgi:hypothetical protein
MKTFVTFYALTLSCFFCQAQTGFQHGYYIRNGGARISGLIKDYGWRNNPTNIVFKSSPADAPVTVEMDSIREFGVGNSKYQRFEIEVETSGDSIDELSNSPAPQYRHDTAFLQVLVEGRASLYLYQNKHLMLYFFRLNSAVPTPLVSKQYLGPDGNVHVNQEYLKKLGDSLSCSASSFADPTRVQYDTKSLIFFFMAYNNCVKSAYTDYWTRSAKIAFHLSIRPGIDQSTFTVSRSGPFAASQQSFGSQASFRIGAEAELILPFNKNKWAVLLEPEYRSYNSSAGGTGFVADYKALQFLLGVRYYMFIGTQSKLYLTAALCSAFQMSSTVEYDGDYLSFGPGWGAGLSVGYRFKDRLGIELRYTTPEDVLGDYIYFKSNLTTSSLILSYRIL